MSAPVDLTLELAPSARFDVVELRARLPAEYREALAPYPSCLYWSAHTTAGFLERSLIARLGGAERVTTYIDTLRRIFPEGAGYAHDRLERRIDLDAAQRAVEPKNADSHLAFIAGGLRPCVTHPNLPDETVYFVDLDGVNEGRPRRRQTRVIGFRNEAVVAQTRLEVPVSHRIESVNLKDPRLGVYDHLAAFVAAAGVGTGRLHLALDPGERHAALTVNEYETLLMKHDLAAVLREPLRFMAAQYRGLVANPRAVPGKALGYATYDLVRVLNSGLDTLGLHDSVVEKVLASTLAVPAARFFRIRRSVHLLVGERADGRHGFVEGTYQSPILVQWQKSPRATRVLHATLTRLD